MRLGDRSTGAFAVSWGVGSVCGWKGFLAVSFNFPTLHKSTLGKRKWIMLAFRPRQFKQSQIGKIVKGHFEGDSVWVLSRRKYFHFSSYFNCAVTFRFFSYTFSLFVNEFFSLRTLINDRKKNNWRERKKNPVQHKCNHSLKGTMWNVCFKR